MNDLQKALSLIEAQQKKAGAGTPAWCVGQQLADILNDQPAAAQIVAEDLGTTGMGIADCEKKIADFAARTARAMWASAALRTLTALSGNFTESRNWKLSPPKHRRPGGTPPQGNPLEDFL